VDNHAAVRATAAFAVLLLMAACSNTTTETESIADLPGISADDYDPIWFGDSANVSHRWYPLRPGTRLEYTGSSVEDGEQLTHGVDIIVTDLFKEIDGVSPSYSRVPTRRCSALPSSPSLRCSHKTRTGTSGTWVVSTRGVSA
jgi:hypothetical protein